MHFDNIEKANLTSKISSDTRIKHLSSDPKVEFKGLEIIFYGAGEFNRLAFGINPNYALYHRLLDLVSFM
jgi:hypothetical protein